jgi:hypothetical protein
VSLIVLRKTTEMSKSTLCRDLGDTTLRSARHQQQRSGLVKPHIAQMSDWADVAEAPKAFKEGT